MIAELETSLDAVLGGRLKLRQPLKGHRVGHDAILLAAATAARAGEHALEFGAGVGAAGLALAARVEGLTVTLVEVDAALAALAAENAKINALADRVRSIAGDVEDMNTFAGLAVGSIDRVLMNPPFHDVERIQPSPDPRRRLAYAGDKDLLARWVESARHLLKPGGALTLIWRADAADDVMAALQAGFGAVATLRVKARAGSPAVRILVRALKNGHGATVDHDTLILYGPQHRPTAAAEAVLRGGETLSLARL